MAVGTRRIAVFGSSEPRTGEAPYELARELGAALARAGCVVVSGGYGGVMEAASRGAREAGGRTIGVGCELFDARAPNPYLDEVRLTPDLHERTRELIDLADGFVVLPGRAGTLAELAMLWALERAGCLAARPVVVLDDTWAALVESLSRDGVLEPSQRRATACATSVDDAVRLVRVARPGDPSGDGA